MRPIIAIIALLCGSGQALAAGDPTPGTSTSSTTQELLEALRQRVEALELGQLDEDLSLQETQPAARFYGFLEFGLQRTFLKEGSLLSAFQPTGGSSFLLGALNFYLDVVPAPRWRALVELRVANFNGGDAFSGGGLSTLNTTQRELGTPGIGIGAQSVTSGLIVERAQIDWYYNDLLSVRAGLWLTPWGIWNVDHGSPTLIPLIMPFFQNYQMYPLSQLGIAVSGAAHASPWTFGYHLGISNGRIGGPITNVGETFPSFDLSDNKMLTGRLHLQNQGGFKVGASAYWGETERQSKQVVELAPIRVERSRETALKEWGVGVDLSLDITALKIRAEFTYTVHRYTNERPISTMFPAHLLPDSAQWGGYILMAYRAAALGVEWEPYAHLELLWWPGAVAPRDMATMPSAGLNVHINEAVQLKLQYGLVRFGVRENGRLDLKRFANDDAHFVTSRLVVSF